MSFLFGCPGDFGEERCVAADIDHGVLMGWVMREARQLQVEETNDDLRRGDLPAKGG